MKNSICIFTIAAKNYSAHARTMFDSVGEFHNDADCFLVLADETGSFETGAGNFRIIEARDIGIPCFTEMSFMYDILEFNTALKPFVMKYFLGRGYKKVIYFDPDIMVFRRLDYLFDLLDRHQILLTPHTITPHSPGETEYPVDRSHLISGVFNLGFIAVADGSESRSFLGWWAERLRENCFFEVEKGLFTDQKWLDLAPCFFQSIHIVRHRGCNMAYWNLHERTLDKKLLVNGEEPLIFYHFSGLEIERLDSISRIQKKYTLRGRKDLAAIFELYRDRVTANGYGKAKNQKYKYSYYDNGRRIGPVSRRLYFLVRHKYPDPFATGPGSYFRLLKSKNLLEKEEEGYYVSKIRKEDVATRVRCANSALKLVSYLIGADRYSQLLRYLRHAAVLRNQEFLVK